MSKNWLYSFIALVIALTLPTVMHAQPPDPGGDPVPIDGGLSLLLAAGAGYGVKKYRDMRKRKLPNTNDTTTK